MAKRAPTPSSPSASPPGGTQAPTPQNAAFVELGISGVTRYGSTSRVYEEFLKELQGPSGMKLLREQIDNCPITGAFLFAAKYLARHVTFRVDAVDNSPEAQRVADRVKGAIFDDLETPWPDTLSEILSMLGFGWSLLEMVFKRCLGPEPPVSIDAATGQRTDGTSLLPDAAISGPTGQGAAPPTFAPSKFNDGFIGFKKWSLRAQETLFMWEWDNESNAIVLQQMAPPDYRVRRIPLSKGLLFRTDVSKNNPEGRAIIRNSVISYLYRKNIQKIEAIGIERDLAGYPVFQVVNPYANAGAQGVSPVPDLWNPKDAEASQLLATLKQLARSIRRDEQEGLVLPWWCEFKLVSTGSRRQFDTSAIITRYDQRIAMSVLADFIMLGHEAVGSKALASTKSQLFTAALSSILDNVCAVANRFAIPLLLKLNGIPQALAPTMAHGDVETIDLMDLGNYIAALSKSGMPLFPNPDLEKALLAAGKLPDTGVFDPNEPLTSDGASAAAQQRAAQAAAAVKPPPASAATAGTPDDGDNFQ